MLAPVVALEGIRQITPQLVGNLLIDNDLDPQSAGLYLASAAPWHDDPP
jgi:hypothetical protein